MIHVNKKIEPRSSKRYLCVGANLYSYGLWYAQNWAFHLKSVRPKSHHTRDENCYGYNVIRCAGSR